MPNLPFENLAAYATEDRIIRLIAKERGKYTAKNGGTSNPFRTDPLFNELKSMCPPHKLWSDPGRGKLPKKRHMDWLDGHQEKIARLCEFIRLSERIWK